MIIVPREADYFDKRSLGVGEVIVMRPKYTLPTAYVCIKDSTIHLPDMWNPERFVAIHHSQVLDPERYKSSQELYLSASRALSNRTPISGAAYVTDHVVMSAKDLMTAEQALKILFAQAIL